MVGHAPLSGVKSITTDMKWYVYILKSLKDGGYYIGCTNSLDRRLSEHNSGYNVSTKLRFPFVLVYSEEFSEKTEAYKREKEIKRYKGGNSFKKLLNM